MKNQLSTYKIVAMTIGVFALFIGSIYLITKSSGKDHPSIFSIIKSEQLDEVVNNKAKTENINEISDKIINALHERNTGKIAEYIHPNKGVTFSPYVFIEDNAPIFNKEEFKNLFKNNDEIYWGIYDGKGKDIQLTASQYFEEFIHSELYIKPDEINVNYINDSGNTENNMMEIFPNTETIEYYHSGSDKYDWESFILVYEKNENNEYFLVALVGNR